MKTLPILMILSFLALASVHGAFVYPIGDQYLRTLNRYLMVDSILTCFAGHNHNHKDGSATEATPPGKGHDHPKDTKKHGSGLFFGRGSWHSFP
ncbi:unnamed protein product [Allacma fusca]|uniref:Uncharacterized protein n=1 Tax=Allacma fusca TaxID=39272 RepID=A0A8J2KW31_9HEXA|nr:unnamed protein product [Allacma fusca]